MLIDKIKSLASAIFLGLLGTSYAEYNVIKWIAERHQSTVQKIWSSMNATRITIWPEDLQLASIIVVVLGLAITNFLVRWLWNFTWTFRPRSLDSAKSATDLTNKSVPKTQPRIFAGQFGGKDLNVSIEDRALVIGPPGTGKTAFLLNQILRATQIKLSFAVIDIKPEIHQILATTLQGAGYRVLRINPARDDPHADHWNPLDDLKDETEIAELCAALLPIRDPKETPFVEAQLDWLKAAVFHVQSQPGGSLPSAYNLLSSQTDAETLLKILSVSTNPTAAQTARRMIAGLSGAKPDPLILQGLTGALRTLDYLGLPGVQSALGHSDFSVRELGQGNQPTALFLQFEESKLKTLGALLAFMCTGLITTLIDTAGQRKPVALFLDELGNMPPIPGLTEKLNTIRSRNIPTWMYFQSTEQIERRYGRGSVAIFFGAADVQMVFRLNDQPTRELISKLVGTTEREKFLQSKNSGTKGGSTSRSFERINVIETHELGQLMPSEVVCLYRGAAAKGRATPYYVNFPAFKRKT